MSLTDGQSASRARPNGRSTRAAGAGCVARIVPGGEGAGVLCPPGHAPAHLSITVMPRV